MQTPLQITFREVAASERIDHYVRTRADKLETFFSRITGCHVTVQAQHHKLNGRQYCVRIDLVVPGDELVVSHVPTERAVQKDLYASIDAAFDAAQRLLHDHAETAQRHRDHRSKRWAS